MNVLFGVTRAGKMLRKPPSHKMIHQDRGDRADASPCLRYSHMSQSGNSFPVRSSLCWGYNHLSNRQCKPQTRYSNPKYLYPQFEVSSTTLTTICNPARNRTRIYHPILRCRREKGPSQQCGGCGGGSACRDHQRE
jgi:hypothetical protein